LVEPVTLTMVLGGLDTRKNMTTMNVGRNSHAKRTMPNDTYARPWSSVTKSN